MSRLLTWKRVIWILTGSFIGLAICGLVGKGKSAFVNGGPGTIVVDVFAAVWSIGLVLLLPLRIFLDRKNRRRVARQFSTGEIDPSQMSLLGEAVFYANYGSLPRWLYMPLVILAMLLVALTVFCITLGVLWSIIHGQAA